jgi:23S rRNA (pseudouridine1915-N3)-methyltransferase
MRISILSVGKFENSPQKAVFETYLKRLKWKIELRELELKNSQSMPIEKAKTGEEELILKALRPFSKMILLDEKGRQFSSRDFAGLISGFALAGDSDLTFVIGGADGFSPALLKKAPLKISFGLMTLPHLMARSILIEQLYRAQSIIAGHPYHRD